MFIHHITIISNIIINISVVLVVINNRSEEKKAQKIKNAKHKLAHTMRC